MLNITQDCIILSPPNLFVISIRNVAKRLDAFVCIHDSNTNMVTLVTLLKTLATWKYIPTVQYYQASFPLFSLHPTLQTFVLVAPSGDCNKTLCGTMALRELANTDSSILIKPCCPEEYSIRNVAIWSSHVTSSCRGRCWCPVAVASFSEHHPSTSPVLLLFPQQYDSLP